MVLKPEPLTRAVEHLKATRGTPGAIVLTSPQGRVLTAREAERLAGLGHVAILCGRYEGVDERIREHVATEEISIGDYVLSGGELAAMVIIDAVSRFVPGVVGDERSVGEDSFSRGLLDFPHYTRPAEFEGWKVPDVLLSGHHAEIDRWRRREALRRTLERRPDPALLLRLLAPARLVRAHGNRRKPRLFVLPDPGFEPVGDGALSHRRRLLPGAAGTAKAQNEPADERRQAEQDEPDDDEERQVRRALLVEREVDEHLGGADGSQDPERPTSRHAPPRDDDSGDHRNSEQERVVHRAVVEDRPQEQGR